MKALPTQDRGRYIPHSFIPAFRLADTIVGEESDDVIGRHQISFIRKYVVRMVRGILATLEQLLGKKLHVVSDVDIRLFPAAKLVNAFKKKGYISGAQFSFDHYFDTPPLVHYNLNHILTPDQTDGRIYNSDSFAFGSDKRPELAVSQAIGEFVERYPLLIYKQANLLSASVAQLKKKKRQHLDLTQVAGFSDTQKRLTAQLQWDEDSVFAWESVRRVRDNKKMLVPAQLVYWNYRFQTNEPVLRETNTNGAAAMSTYPDAVLGGLHELIQRDGLMVYWFNTITPPQIDPATIPFTNFQTQVAEAEEYGFKVQVVNLTTELGIATYGIILEDTKSNIFPKRVFGLNTHFDPERALHRAFTEAWNIYRWMRSVGPSDLVMEDIIACPFSFTVERVDRCRLFGMAKYEQYFDFFWSGDVESFTDHEVTLYRNNHLEPQERLDDLVAHLEAFGEDYTVYAAQARHEILRLSDCYSVRVIVPALVPLHLGSEVHAHTGGKRIADFAIATTGLVREHYNPVPQSFP